MNPPYCPDLSPSNNHLFRSRQNSLASVKLTSKEACENQSFLHRNHRTSVVPDSFHYSMKRHLFITYRNVTCSNFGKSKFHCWDTSNQCRQVMIAINNINANPISGKKVGIEWHWNVKIWKETESRMKLLNAFQCPRIKMHSKVSFSIPFLSRFEHQCHSISTCLLGIF